MCGISGIITKQVTPEADLDALIGRFNSRLKHRGPDAAGSWCHSNIALGHRRLSIIDLSDAGNQPMSTTDNNYLIIFNGEIYNFRELKEELMTKGHQFHTASDTEVILHAYEEWGTGAFNRFNGMFAFSLYDKQKNELLLVRDHAGIKPLYYHLSHEHLLFSSEIRCFKEFNPNWNKNPYWSYQFLSFGFIPFPYTTLDDVFVLPKGHFLKININSFETSMQSYHQFRFTETITSEKEALEKTRAVLIASLDRHMISDAPLGIFLSGGIDSSLLALIADYRKHPNLNTISVTFNEASYNEEPFQNLVLDKMRSHTHKKYKVDERLFLKYLPDIFEAMDQPSWDGINSYFVSKCAQDAGLKVVLSGLGSDELFGGYPSFQRVLLLNALRFLPSSITKFSSKFNSSISRLALLGLPTNYNEYLFLRGCFDAVTISKITQKPVEEVITSFEVLNLKDVPLKRDQNLASYLETNVYMENQLLKDTDYMSMWHSLEVRVPYLDKELMELTNSIHPKIKYNKSQPKCLITKAFNDMLPPEIIFRKKQGFTFPFSIWLKNNMDYFKGLIPDTPVTTQLVHGFLNGQVHWSRIWSLIVYKKFMD